jgi:fumarylpyruvate hydrolase
MSTQYVIEPVALPSLPVAGDARRFAVNRIYCVGRNYADHAREMGHDPDREPPFFFMKPASAIVTDGENMQYPSLSNDVHHEIEMVVAIGKGGANITSDKALEHVYGYGVGLDMTRRDLQLVARDKGRPWDLGKDIEQGSVCSEIVPMPGVVIENGAIALEVNGATKQSSNVDKLIWNIREIIADLSNYYHLQPGDLIYTGTPEGVGAVLPGDRITGRVEGVAELALTIGPAESSMKL